MAPKPGRGRQEVRRGRIAVSQCMFILNNVRWVCHMCCYVRSWQFELCVSHVFVSFLYSDIVAMIVYFICQALDVAKTSERLKTNIGLHTHSEILKASAFLACIRPARNAWRSGMPCGNARRSILAFSRSVLTFLRGVPIWRSCVAFSRYWRSWRSARSVPLLGVLAWRSLRSRAVWLRVCVCVCVCVIWFWLPLVLRFYNYFVIIIIFSILIIIIISTAAVPSCIDSGVTHEPAASCPANINNNK